MPKPNSARLIFTLLLFAALTACNLPTAATPLPTASLQPPTQTLLPPSATSAPTETATPADTAAPTLPPTPAETATPQPITARLLQDSNCLSGPAGNYELVSTYPVGARVEVIAKDLGGYFWLIRDPANPDQTCWLNSTRIEIDGDTSTLAAVTPPASPTPVPAFTIAYKNSDICKGPFMRFEVVNNGGEQFRSAYIKITDQKTGEISEQAVLAFDFTVGCVVARNITPLKPGSTGYLQSTPFKKPYLGHKIKATFMLCTEQGLKGACATQTLEFTPK